MISVLLGVCAALSWSIHDILARSLAARIGPFRMAALVMVAGGVLLSGHAVTSETLSTARPATLLLAASLGLAYGFGVAGLFKAFSLGPVTVVAPLTAAYPILVVLWGIFHGLAPTPLQWAAAAVAGAERAPLHAVAQRYRGLPSKHRTGSSDVRLAHLGVINRQRAVFQLGARSGDAQDVFAKLLDGHFPRIPNVHRFMKIAHDEFVHPVDQIAYVTKGPGLGTVPEHC